MDDLLSENAALHALGLLTGDELAAFEQALRENPALDAEVRAMTEATLLLAKSAPQAAPPAGLRAALLAAFEAGADTPPAPDTESANGAAARRPQNVKPPPPPAPGLQSVPPAPPQSVPSPPQSAPRLLHLLPWAAAATLAVLFFQQKSESSRLAGEAARLRSENTLVADRERHYLDAIRVSEASGTESARALAGARGALEKAETRLRSIEGENSTLLTELSALRQDSQLDKTRIAVLGSLLKDQPKAVAVSLWRQQTQQGLLVVENLPALPPGRDYQLWVIDPNHKSPVSAGVFKVDPDGKVRIEFKPALPVREASKFAVTVEREGGSPTPHLDQLVVIGG